MPKSRRRGRRRKTLSTSQVRLIDVWTSGLPLEAVKLDLGDIRTIRACKISPPDRVDPAATIWRKLPVLILCRRFPDRNHRSKLDYSFVVSLRTGDDIKTYMASFHARQIRYANKIPYQKWFESCRQTRTKRLVLVRTPTGSKNMTRSNTCINTLLKFTKPGKLDW